MGIIELALGAIIELGVQAPIEAAWGAAKRRETVIRLLRRIGLDPSAPPKDFEPLYAYTLVEWGIFKPEPILEFFRYEYVKDAFQRAFYEGSMESLEREAEEIIRWNEETGELGPIHNVPNKEIITFGTVFRTLALQSRTPSEVLRDQDIADIHKQSQEILKKLEHLDTFDEVRHALKQLHIITSESYVNRTVPNRRIVHPLVPAATFQSRPELFDLFNWWSGETKQGIVALVGMGGTGKTAIAHEFLLQLYKGEVQTNKESEPIELQPPDLLFVWSFYDAPYVDEFFTVLLSFLTKRSYDPENRRANIFQVLAALESYSETRILLVLDGLERIQESSIESGVLGEVQDHSLKQFVRRIASGIEDIRLIVTTRLPLRAHLNIIFRVILVHKRRYSDCENGLHRKAYMT